MSAARALFARRNLALGAKIVGLSLLYTVVAMLGLSLDPVGRFATLVWAPSGIALAAFVVLGYGVAPGVLVGAFVANSWSGAPLLVALGIAMGNTVEALLGAYAMRRVAGSGEPLEGLPQVLALIVPAALMSTLVGATVGLASLALSGIVSRDLYWGVFRAWWVGDVLGDLIVAPFLLAHTRSHRATSRPSHVAEGILLAVSLVASSWIVFFRTPGMVVYPFESPYVLFPLFIWAAVRFRLSGATASTAVASALAIWGTVRGSGPFVRETLSQGLLALQTFMGCAALTPLVVAGAISDRARLEARAALDAARREERFRILSQASRDFVESNLSLPGLFDVMAHHLVAAIGDGCAIQLLTEDGEHLTVAALHHADPDGLSFLRAVLGAGPEKLSDRPSGGVVRTGNALELPTVDQEDFHEWLGARSVPHMDRFGVHAILVVPIRSRGSIIGSIALLRTSPGRPYTSEDRSLLEELSERAGLALHNARLHEDLRAAVQVRDDFLAIAGHELKTPLAAMLMQLQGLSRAAERAPGKLGDRVARAARSGLRLQRLIDQLLDVSRITAGKLRIESEYLDLSEVVTEVALRFSEGSSPDSPISLDIEESVNGRWDRLRLEQVVDNLVGNAVKYGRGKPILVELRLVEDQAILTVTDHGIGISPEHQKKIFQRFERAVAARDFGGLGLGLWITRQIVEASGGTIQVQSQAGEGATFTVRLPVGQEGSAES